MSYTAPTAADLKARFPAFAAVDDAIITSALTDAARRVDETWTEGDFAMARMLLACHSLAIDGFGASREIQTMGFRRIKVGPLDLERFGSDQQAGAIGSTSYGQRFQDLARLNFPGGTVTG